MVAEVSFFDSPQCFVDGPGLPQGVFFPPGCIYDEIGELSFLFKRHLAADPRAHAGLHRAAAPQSALHLLLHGAPHQDDAVESLIAAGLDKDGRLHHRDALRLARGEFGDQLLLAAPHPRGITGGSPRAFSRTSRSGEPNAWVASCWRSMRPPSVRISRPNSRTTAS